MARRLQFPGPGAQAPSCSARAEFLLAVWNPTTSWREDKYGKLRDTLGFSRASLVAQTLKNLPAMQETQVQCLGRKDPLEKGMTTHSSILAWRILGQRSLAGVTGHRVGHD